MSAVRRTDDLRRILALPRRAPEDREALIDELTGLCRRPAGTMRLRWLQALALRDVCELGGGFCPVGVGEGKTLLSLLIPYVLQSAKPILLLPAGLIDNAERARKALSPHWLIPTNLRIYSLEMLGRTRAKDMLYEFKPDLIICDEAHRLKSLKAACTKRVARYMAAHSDTAFVPMSGTMMRDSIKDYAHLLWWALKRGTPLPQDRNELEEWASALDEPKPGRPGVEYSRVEPGALLDFCSLEERSRDQVTAARLGFRRRLAETPGVVASDEDGEHVGASIYIRAIKPTYNAATDEHFRKLRGDATDRKAYPGWERPDGKVFEQGVEVWACARQLAVGLHYEWNPPPPDEWMVARKAWSKFVRDLLAHSRTYDSPDEVAQAILDGRRKDEGGVLAAWRKVRDTFRPNTVAVWHDDSVLKLCAEWAKQPGIIWTEHSLFGRRLAQLTKLPYYGRKGFNADGGYIEDGDPSKAIIASIDANRDGKNLQAREVKPGVWEPLWNRNLIVSPPDGADVWQQAIARTHRPHQQADEVIVDVLFGCREHVNAWSKAMAGAVAIRDTMGGTQKLLLADVQFDASEFDGLRGPRW